MVFQMHEFEDLPEGWMVKNQNRSGVLFRHDEQEVSVRLHQDEDHDFWVVMQHRRRPSELLFQQRFRTVGDAIRTATSVMSLYNMLWNQTVDEVVNNVSLAFMLTQAFREDEDNDEMEGTEQVIVKIETALQEGDYEQIRQIADTAAAVVHEHSDDEMSTE